MRETYRCEYVKCGNPRCKSCPHGPYWYAYWREGKKVRKRYIGKVRPAEDDTKPPKGKAHWAAILDGRTATRELAWEILGMETQFDSTLSAYRAASLRMHPDRGGSDFEQKCINAAYTFLK